MTDKQTKRKLEKTTGPEYQDLMVRKQPKGNLGRNSLEEDLLWEVEVSASIAELAGKLIKPNSLEEISSLVLEHGRYLTGSKAGFVGYLDPEKGYLVASAIVREGIPDLQVETSGNHYNTLTGPWGWVLENRKSLMSNSPEDATEAPEGPLGDTRIERFLSAPALSDESLVGQIAFANSDRDYSERDLILVKRLAVLYSIALQRFRMDEALRKAHQTLEKKVHERTEQLAKANEELKQEIAIRLVAEKELKEAKGAAEGANRAKSEFVASVSHELRTPLNHILGFTELILDKKFGDLNETQEEFLNDVYGSSKHLLSLINDILDLSKIEAGRLTLEISEVNPREILESSLVIIKQKALERGMQLTHRIDGIPETMMADGRKLKQIVYNLLSNAVKFTPRGGSIRLKAELVNGAKGLIERPFSRDEPVENYGAKASRKLLQVTVADTGNGLKKEDLERIFNPFEQVESSISRRYEGTGLGLSLSKKFVELHGGRIWAESEGEGKGSNFRLLIPIIEGKAGP